MRNWVMAAAALAAVVALPSVAAAQATGYVGLDYANTDTNLSDSNDAWGASGSVAFAGSSSISFEVDAAILDGDNSDTSEALTGHVFTRNDSYLFGGFVGYQHSDAADAWSAGLEANKYWDSFTLAGAVVYANSDDVDTSAWGVNAEGRYFINDNFRVDGDLGWANVDLPGAGNDDNVWSAGVGAEYQFSEAPVSIGAHYSHFEFNDANVDGNVWAVSLRYNFGGSLKDRDRSGASQSSITGIGGVTGVF
ncbi:MAG: outer membrane beta-barrel protein [Terricaulis sp.]